MLQIINHEYTYMCVCQADSRSITFKAGSERHVGSFLHHRTGVRDQKLSELTVGTVITSGQFWEEKFSTIGLKFG